MNCIVCKKPFSNRETNKNRAPLVCSMKCRLEWNTKLHFIDIPWNYPKFSINANYGSHIQFNDVLKPKKRASYRRYY